MYIYVYIFRGFLYMAKISAGHVHEKKKMSFRRSHVKHTRIYLPVHVFVLHLLLHVVGAPSPRSAQ